MKYLLLATMLILALAGRQNAEEQDWAKKVDASLLKKVADGQSAEFLVLLHAQASLSSARNLKTKEEKGAFAYQALRAVARQSQQPLIDLLEKEQAPYQSFFIINALKVEGGLALIRRIAEMDIVAQVQDNPGIRLQQPYPEENPEIASRSAVEWGIARINADAVWDLGYQGQGVVIGGQDTGFEWDHPAIKPTYRGWNGESADHNYNWHDAIHRLDPLNGDTTNASANPCGLDSPVPCDDHNHGTHTMGIMAGLESDQGTSIGVAPEARWVACRNMERGVGTPATYIECFEWFLAPTDLNGENPDPTKAPHVINNSWSCPEIEGCNESNFAAMRAVVDNLKAAGIVVVVSAGNSGLGCGTVNTPAAIFESSFSVGATRQNDTIANFSSRGPVLVDESGRLKPNVSAPGVSVRSAIRNGGYANFSGTSMAGPHVAGLVALLISAEPSLAGQVEEIETIIESTAKPMVSSQDCGGFSGMAVPNTIYGYGRVDALAAVMEALGVSDTDSPLKAGQALVFPNPASGQAMVQLEGIEGIVRFELFSLSGKRLYEGRWEATEGESFELSLSGLPSGIYLYRLLSNKKQYSGKLIKQ